MDGQFSPVAILRHNILRNVATRKEYFLENRSFAEPTVLIKIVEFNTGGWLHAYDVAMDSLYRVASVDFVEISC